MELESKVRKPFSEVLSGQPGAARRSALLTWFQSGTPENPVRLPVNNKHELQTSDPDLAVLLKKGQLVRQRDGGRPITLQLNEGTARQPVYKWTGKRQTYLVLPSK